MKQYDLSVVITARNEEFLGLTIKGVLEKRRGNTEVIAICDGYWPEPPIEDHPDVTIIYHSESIGQRAGVNEGVRLSKAKFIMKLDAHCLLDEGFDVKLMADCEYNWTVIPRMYNLHAFDWVCDSCKDRIYQGPTPEKCGKCKGKMHREMVWKPRLSRMSDFMRFDKDLHFQYWGDFKNRPEAKGQIADTMSNLGACFFMHRQFYWDIEGLDEAHGSWGQMGTEISCKTWLIGGRQVVNKNTWFSHMFRTQGGDFGFPYPMSGSDVDRARKHSKEIWRNNKWPKAVHTLEWLVDRFKPIPGWHDKETMEKGIIFYTDNQFDLKIAHAVQKNLKRQSEALKIPIVSASLKPMNFGENHHVKLERGYLTMFKQILTALENSKAKYIYFCEHDVMYPDEHFAFIPPTDDKFYYNINVWKINADTGHCIHYDCQQVSGIVVNRDLAIQHYKKRVEIIEKSGFSMKMGFEPGTHNRPERVDDIKSDSFSSVSPIVDIRHGSNLSQTRWSKDQFRNQKFTEGWAESDNIPSWGNGIELLKKWGIL